MGEGGNQLRFALALEDLIVVGKAPVRDVPQRFFVDYRLVDEAAAQEGGAGNPRDEAVIVSKSGKGIRPGMGGQVSPWAFTSLMAGQADQAQSC